MESSLINIGVGLVAAAFGVFVGVRVNEVNIEAIKQRLDRIENKVDRIIERGAR